MNGGTFLGVTPYVSTSSTGRNRKWQVQKRVNGRVHRLGAYTDEKVGAAVIDAIEVDPGLFDAAYRTQWLERMTDNHMAKEWLNDHFSKEALSTKASLVLKPHLKPLSDTGRRRASAIKRIRESKRFELGVNSQIYKPGSVRVNQILSKYSKSKRRRRS